MYVVIVNIIVVIIIQVHVLIQLIDIAYHITCPHCPYFIRPPLHHYPYRITTHTINTIVMIIRTKTKLQQVSMK